MTPYDELSIDTRRHNWGWFGDPWPSAICYDYDDGARLMSEMQKPFPVGESCLWCGVPFEPGDSGVAMPHLSADGPELVRHVHKECQLRAVTGSVSCYRGEHHHDTGKTYREEALELWAYLASPEAMGGNRDRSHRLGASPDVSPA